MFIRFARPSLVLVCLLASAPLASAQASRTWVSGVGDDANPCSRTAPCKTFAGAISKTAAGGEISVLDPGGFGAVTVTKSITIDGVGTLGSILASGSNAIIVNAGPGDVVTLRHLQLNGVGTGLVGIKFLNGAALVVDDVDIYGFDSGLEVYTGSATVVDATISNSRSVAVNGLGGSVTVERSMLTANNIAVIATTPGVVRLSDNSIYDNLTGFACGGGVIASAGNNRKAGNVGGSVPVCGPTQAINIQ